jgi:ribose-phosphate pyrophosphokinase
MISVHGKQINSFNYPGGEVHISSETAILGATVRADLRSSNDIMELLIFADAYHRRFNGIPLKLKIPYLPYARQDRVANNGDPLSVKVMADLINSCKAESVEIWDCHSDVGLALINNVVHVPQHHFVRVFQDGPAVMIAPDAGAQKKTLKCAQEFETTQVVMATKHRDTRTGEITNTTIDGVIPASGHLMVVDDICDGGRTFIELAKAIYNRGLFTKGLNALSLYVTHGIFSKGVTELFQYYDHIYTANPWSSVTVKVPAIENLVFEVSRNQSVS